MKESENMNMSKEKLKQLLEYTFRSGMLYGYGVNHENIEKDENDAWEEFWKSIKDKEKFK